MLLLSPHIIVGGHPRCFHRDRSMAASCRSRPSGPAIVCPFCRQVWLYLECQPRTVTDGTQSQLCHAPGLKRELWMEPHHPSLKLLAGVENSRGVLHLGPGGTSNWLRHSWGRAGLREGYTHACRVTVDIGKPGRGCTES